MGLDRGAGSLMGQALNHIWIKCTLEQKLGIKLQRFLFEDLNKSVSNDLALLFRLRNPSQFAEEELSSVHEVDIHSATYSQALYNLLGLVLAQHAIVYQNAMELVADRFVHKHGSNCGIHAARNRTNHLGVFHNTADLIHTFLHKFGHAPIAFASTNLLHKVFQNLRSVLGMSHFRMELESVDMFGSIRCDRVLSIIRACNIMERRRQLNDLVSMAHPDGKLFRQVLEQQTRLSVLEYFELCIAKLLLLARHDFPTELVARFLEPIADSKNRKAKVRQIALDVWRILLVHRCWSAGQNEAFELCPGCLELEDIGVTGKELGVDPAFAQPAGNEMGVLRSKVQNGDQLMLI
mmetsp:Transcript_1267/g.2080  ORF Transcript_1267/g.2080 Transcript_1267/m.2080 type:complete len:350 (-) Transcript_1267:98-1147(-)